MGSPNPRGNSTKEKREREREREREGGDSCLDVWVTQENVTFTNGWPLNKMRMERDTVKEKEKAKGCAKKIVHGSLIFVSSNTFRIS